jgi:hypothetical protein
VEIENLSRAQIDPAKIRDYLRSACHPRGRQKARFFMALGFRKNAWIRLQHAILVHAAGANVAVASSAYGRKFVAEGILKRTAGRRALV